MSKEKDKDIVVKDLYKVLQTQIISDKDIDALTIGKLLKISGAVLELFRLENERELLEVKNNYDSESDIASKIVVVKDLLEREIKIVDNFVATLAIGKYDRKYSNGLMQKEKMQIITNVMNDSNDSMKRLTERLKNVVEDNYPKVVK